ncbi:MAG: hypothetical protein ACI89J_000378 [Hyphomicrobiaceae bacterium]|jgi:hypothetical protein
MSTIYQNVIWVIAGSLVLAGCSSSNQSRTADYAQSGRSDSATINYYNSGSSSGPARAPYSLQASPAPLQYRPRLRAAPAYARRAIQPPTNSTSVPRLRRYAAMPRHKPHAPHVRQNERSCLSSGIVQPTSFIRPRRSIGGGQCYISKPFTMSAAARGQVRFQPAATVRCQMVPSVEAWVQNVLRPAARRYLGSDIVQLRIAASYACRTRNHKAGGKLSEHGKANAIDVSKFHLADGRVVTVKKGWRGSEGERRFLRYIHRGACEHFSTVLGPNADRYHHDHFHFDLARHGRRGTYRVCK